MTSREIFAAKNVPVIPGNPWTLDEGGHIVPTGISRRQRRCAAASKTEPLQRQEGAAVHIDNLPVQEDIT